MESSGTRAVGKYFCSLLEVENQPVVVILASLAALLDLLDQDATEELRKFTVKEGLVTSLVNILNKPYKGSNADSTDPCSIPHDCGINAGVLQSGGCQSSSPRCRKVCHSLTYTLALRCLHSFCTMHQVIHAQFMQKSLFQCLIKFLNPNPNRDEPNFYEFAPSFTSALRDLVSSDSGYVHISSELDCKINEDDLVTELHFYDPKEAEIVRHIKQNISFSSIRVKTDYGDEDVSENLISQKVAWQKQRKLRDTEDSNHVEEKDGKHKYDKEGYKDKKLVWQEACVTKVLDGNFLWILKGKDAMKASAALCATLKKEQPKMSNIIPQVHDIVAAKITSGSEWKVVRARVTLINGSTLQVFDVDSGVISEISSQCVYSLPTSLGLKHISPLASLVRLKGVIPTPLDPRAVELAAASIVALTRNNVTAINYLLETDIISVLPDLIGSPEPEVTSQSFRIAANILLRKRLTCCNKWLEILLASLDALNGCVQRKLYHKFMSRNNSFASQCAKSDDTADKSLRNQLTCQDNAGVSGSRNKSVILSCLLFLSNRLLMSPVAKEFFYRIQGLDTVLRVYLLFKNDRNILTVAMQVLSNFVHVCLARHFKDFTVFSSFQSNAPQPSVAESSMNSVQGKMKGLASSSVIYQETGHVSEEDSDGTDDNDDDGGDDEAGDVSANDSGIVAGRCPLSNRTKDGVSEETGVRNSGSGEEYYTYGQVVPFLSDSSHELHQSCHLSAESFASVICGMLNTGHKGTIYLGITESGVVLGERLPQRIRDEIRLGVDRILMSQIHPSVLHSQFSVKYVPVKGVHTDSEVMHYADLYVVEIMCVPVPRVIYCCNKDMCFYRVGGSTVTLTPQDVRHMVVIEEEAWCKDQIELLHQRLGELLKLEAQL